MKWSELHEQSSHDGNRDHLNTFKTSSIQLFSALDCEITGFFLEARNGRTRPWLAEHALGLPLFRVYV